MKLLEMTKPENRFCAQISRLILEIDQSSRNQVTIKSINSFSKTPIYQNYLAKIVFFPR